MAALNHQTLSFMLLQYLSIYHFSLNLVWQVNLDSIVLWKLLRYMYKRRKLSSRLLLHLYNSCFCIFVISSAVSFHLSFDCGVCQLQIVILAQD